MNAKRIAKHAGNIRTWNAELDRERHRALAEAVLKPDDHGPDGMAATTRAVRTETVEINAATNSARRIVCECLIDTLCAQNHLTREQHKAGLWFRCQYLLGYQNAVVTAGYGERVTGSVGDGISSRVLDARHALGEMAQVLSMLEWSAVESAAGHDTPLGRGRLRSLQSGLDLVGLYQATTRRV